MNKRCGQSRTVVRSCGHHRSLSAMIIRRAAADIDGLKLRNSALKSGSRVCARAIVTSHCSIHLRDRSML